MMIDVYKNSFPQVIDLIKKEWQRPEYQLAYLPCEVRMMETNYEYIHSELRKKVRALEYRLKYDTSRDRIKMQLMRITKCGVYAAGVIQFGMLIYEFYNKKSFPQIPGYNPYIGLSYVATMGGSRSTDLNRCIEEVDKIITTSVWIDNYLESYFPHFIDVDHLMFHILNYDDGECNMARIKDLMIYLIYKANAPKTEEQELLVLKKLKAVHQTNILPMWWYKHKCQHVMNKLELTTSPPTDLVLYNAVTMFLQALPLFLQWNKKVSVVYLFLSSFIPWGDNERYAEYDEKCRKIKGLFKYLQY